VKTIGAILAGGRSNRFGSPKCIADLGGIQLIEWVLRAQREVLDEVVIVANAPDRFTGLGVPIVPDILPGRGPLSGIHAALSHAAGDAVLLSPCDAPYGVPALYRLLLDSNDDVQAVFPRSRGPLGYEPLFGWFSGSVLPLLTTFLKSPSDAVHDFVDTLDRVRYVPVEDIDPIGGGELIFLNVNTADDLRAAELHLRPEADREG
jgi:molybdenum cofactor guanylyltransferase